MQVLVRDNNVDQALKVLKKKMQREGVFREMKLRGHYEKPSERRVREKAEAIRRARKLARKKLQREGLLPMKPRVDCPAPTACGRSARSTTFKTTAPSRSLRAIASRRCGVHTCRKRRLRFQLNTSGELAAGAISRRGTTVGLYVPLSPGIRQLAFTYELPASAFPLAIPVERPTGVFEVLIQEPTARVEGPSLREMAPVSTDGRVFRRFLAEDLSASAVMRIEMPRIIGAERERVYFGVGIALLAAMVVSLVFASRRSAPRRAVVTTQPVEAPSRALIRAIAALDTDFERSAAADDATREAYATKRASLKSELAAALAAERR